MPASLSDARVSTATTDESALADVVPVRAVLLVDRLAAANNGPSAAGPGGSIPTATPVDP